MSTRSIEKKALILEKAKQVFIRKGYNGVTMKDIVEECGISRGGLYLYYNSVDEIFMDVIESHNDTKLKQLQVSIKDDSVFQELLDRYFQMQTERLLHMENSLMLAMYEFFLAHKKEFNKNFFFNQFHNTKKMILEILTFGAEKGLTEQNSINKLSEMIMFVIEGLGTLAMSSGVTKELVDQQFTLLKRIVIKNPEKEQSDEK